MKKITFFLALVVTSLGFSQVVLEDFESSYPAGDLEAFEGASSAAVVADPAPGGTNGNVLEIISEATGNPWQGASMLLQDNYIDLTAASTSQQITMDVYSTSSFGMLVVVEDGQNSAPRAGGDSDTNIDYVGGSGWQTITVTLNQNLDGTGTADGEYGKLALFPGWSNATDGWAICCNPGQGIASTIYIDNITGIEGSPIAAPEPDPAAAPLPTLPDGDVFSIYNDTNGYTNSFPFVYDFGSLDGEPNLDTGGGTNLAYKFNFSVAGYGVGEGGPEDVSAYNFVSFDYYARAGTPGFQFRLISNNTDPVTEAIYEVGTDTPVVNDAWTKVVIPMSVFTGQGFSDTQFFQWKMDPFMQSVAMGGIVYVDNILLSTGNPLSVDTIETAEFSVYPNPTNGNWNLSSNTNLSKVEVYDVLGKQVISLTPNAMDAVIDASSLKTGVYFARIQGLNGSKTVKLVKQ